MSESPSSERSFAPLRGRVTTRLAIGVPRSLLVVTLEHLAARVAAAAGEVAQFLDSWVVSAAGPLGGRVARLDGDHIVVVFREPAGAVRCALELQDMLYSSSEGRASGGPPACKVMVTTGSVVPWQGDVLTSLVPRALNHCRAEKRPYAVLVDDVTRNAVALARRTVQAEEREGSSVYRFEPAEMGPPYAVLVAEAASGGDTSALVTSLGAWAGGARSVAAQLTGALRSRPALGAVIVALVAALLGVVAGLSALLSGGDDVTPSRQAAYAEDDIRGWTVKDLVAYLGDRDVEDILAELQRRPPQEVKDAMVREVETGSYLRRHRALQVLEGGGTALDEHYQTVAIRDVENGPSCEAWVEGLEVLEARAVDTRALDALSSLKARKGAKACVDFPATEAAIRARLQTR